MCVLFGCDVPVLLHEREGNRLAFIGESYIQRLMDGEAVEALERGKVTAMKFNLV